MWDIDGNPECMFFTWFKGVAARHGMLIQFRNNEAKRIPHQSSPIDVYDQDCHLIWLGVGDFSYYSYGSRLWNAKTTSNPELKKLEGLFRELELDSPRSPVFA